MRWNLKSKPNPEKVQAIQSALANNIKKFIHISTDEVYGSIAEGSYTETDNLNPSSPYSSSKPKVP